MLNGEIKTRKQFWFMLLAMIVDTIWVFTPGALFMIFVAPYGSLDGALGNGVGVLLMIVIAVLLTRLWSPLAWRISEPVIRMLAKRIGVIPPEEE